MRVLLFHGLLKIADESVKKFLLSRFSLVAIPADLKLTAADVTRRDGNKNDS